jgi:hypothetical protein
MSSSVKGLITKESMINNYHTYIRNFNVGDDEIYEVLLINDNSGVLFAGHGIQKNIYRNTAKP